MKVLILSILFFSSLGFSQAKKFASFKGKVMHDGAIVYSEADFDSQVLGYAKIGGIYEISSKTFGVFYRIQVKPGVIGYIADSDIMPLNKVSAKGNIESTQKEKGERPKKHRSFENARYFGLQYSQVNYFEETMGRGLTESLAFFGMKLSGPYLLIQGPINTEMNFIFHMGAPSYYEKYTGHAAAGWIFMTDFLIQMVLPQGKNTMFYFGFGPMFRISKFQTVVGSGTATTTYNLEDMALGAAFNLGIGFRMGAVALRAEGKYYWEKYKNTAANLALQFEF